ncbi:MAG TPA: endonuclease/exonuclease/phosphatase family protein [Luteimonas sp.]|nr:endonuclease/exonuclease/phosphatase family protein [Luteimonas sp.]
MRSSPLLLVGLLTLAVLAAQGCASHPASGDGDGDDDGGAPRELTLVTLNLWHDKGDWPARERMIVARLRELHPDVVTLQEVLQREGLPNQAESIADALGYACVFASVDPPDAAKRFGNAILTRHPILAHDWKPLEPLDDYRNIVRARIDIDGRAIDVYDMHLHWTEQGGAIRATQVADALRWIRSHGDGTASVLAGDLNASMDAAELQPLLGPYLDAYAAMHPRVAHGDRAHSTLNLTQYAPRHIDQVLLQRGAFVPVEARVILDRPDAAGTWASDHYGVLVRFRFAGERAAR